MRWKRLPLGAKVAGSTPVPRVKKPLSRMNKTEAAYAEILKLSQMAGEVRWWAYEPIKFRLAKRTWYTPDFLVVGSDGRIEAIEVKGFLRDDAAVKFKFAREKFPWINFCMVIRKGGEWVEILR